jgi:amidohydrolase
VLCEYDALPGIGHACGHNIIGAAGLGAGLAAAALADEVGGRIVIMGTPAEEGGGGKVLMAERGAFDDVDAAMMVHPAQADLVAMNVIANHRLLVDYHGQAAHAAASPERGVNALDAAVLGYVNIAALRQHIRADERVHGIFTEAGENPNIVPRHAQANWYVRSPRLRTLRALTERVIAGLEAGAAASGCTMDYVWKAPAYFDMLDNGPLADLYVANAATTGRAVSGADHAPLVVGSTDMGNVSYVVPAIHPMIKVAPPTVSLHSPEFTRYAASAEGDRAVVDAAKAMAMTVLDLWLRPDALASMREAHRDAVETADSDPALLGFSG